MVAAFAIRRVPEPSADQPEAPSSPPVAVLTQPAQATPAEVSPTVAPPVVPPPRDDEVDVPVVANAPGEAPPQADLDLPPPRLPPDEGPTGGEGVDDAEAAAGASPVASPVVRVPPPESRDRPVPAAERPSRARGEIALTSKVPGKVVALVGGNRVELYTNAVRSVTVPPGTSQVRFQVPDTGGACAVLVDVLPNLRRALVFGPEPTSVVLRDPSSGAKKLTCQSP